MHNIFDQEPTHAHAPQGNQQRPHTHHHEKKQAARVHDLPLFRTPLDGIGERANEAIIKLSLFFSTGFGAFGVGYIFNALLDTNLPNLDNVLQDALSYIVGFGLCYIADFKGLNGILPVAVSQFSAFTTGKFAINGLSVLRAT